MQNYGFKISQEGFDTDLAADKNLVYSSKFNSLKIFDEVDRNAEFHDHQRWTSNDPHGLAYSPSFLTFFKALFYGGNQYWIPDGGGYYGIPIYDPSKTTNAGTTLNDGSICRSWSDDTNWNTMVDNLTGDVNNRTYYVKLFILIEDNA